MGMLIGIYGDYIGVYWVPKTKMGFRFRGLGFQGLGSFPIRAPTKG